MQQLTHKQFYILHSWMGIVAGILLFVICYTGALAVFASPYLKTWANPELHSYQEISPDAIEQLVLSHAQTLPPEYQQSIDIFFPAVRRSVNLEIHFSAERETEAGQFRRHTIVFEHDPVSLLLQRKIEGSAEALYQQRQQDFSDFFITFHADLNLGSPWGLIITGLAGLILLSSIVSGVAIHPKIIKELFTFRPFRSLRLLWTDAHKVFGVWGMLFHSIIGFTGAYLGFAAVVLVPASVLVSFQGDYQAMVSAVLPDITPVLSGEVMHIEISNALQALQEKNPGDVVSISLLGGADSNAVVIANTLPGQHVNPVMLEFRAQGGTYQQSHTTFGRISGSGAVLDVIEPLHFGNFGGLLVKVLWGVLGMSTAFVSFSGMMIFIERRAYGSVGQLGNTSYLRMSRFVIGACFGLIAASLLLFLHQPLKQYFMPVSMAWVFFGSWLVAIVWAMSRANEYLAARQLLCFIAFILLALPFVNGFNPFTHTWSAANSSAFMVLAVDAVLFILGLMVYKLSRRIPLQREPA